MRCRRTKPTAFPSLLIAEQRIVLELKKGKRNAGNEVTQKHWENWWVRKEGERLLVTIQALFLGLLAVDIVIES